MLLFNTSAVPSMLPPATKQAQTGLPTIWDGSESGGEAARQVALLHAWNSQQRKRWRARQWWRVGQVVSVLCTLTLVCAGAVIGIHRAKVHHHRRDEMDCHRW